jgi:hypothetical protein
VDTTNGVLHIGIVNELDISKRDEVALQSEATSQTTSQTTNEAAVRADDTRKDTFFTLGRQGEGCCREGEGDESVLHFEKECELTSVGKLVGGEVKRIEVMCSGERQNDLNDGEEPFIYLCILLLMLAVMAKGTVSSQNTFAIILESWIP